MSELPPIPQDQDLLDLLPLLTRVARHMAPDADTAGDLVQDTVLSLHQRLQDGPRIDRLRPYALTVLRNAARRARAQAAPTSELTESCAMTAPDAPARLACADLDRAIDGLPTDQAVLIRMVREGHDSPADLARMTGLPPGTVMSRLARARRRLRVQMEMTESDSTASLWN